MINWLFPDFLEYPRCLIGVFFGITIVEPGGARTEFRYGSLPLFLTLGFDNVGCSWRLVVKWTLNGGNTG